MRSDRVSEGIGILQVTLSDSNHFLKSFAVLALLGALDAWEGGMVDSCAAKRGPAEAKEQKSGSYEREFGTAALVWPCDRLLVFDRQAEDLTSWKKNHRPPR